MRTILAGLLLLAFSVSAQRASRQQDQTRALREFPAISGELIAGCTKLKSGALRCDSAGMVLDLDSSGRLSGLMIQSLDGADSEQDCRSALSAARPSAVAGRIWKDGKNAPKTTMFFKENGFVIAGTWTDNAVMGKHCWVQMCNPATDNLPPFCLNLATRAEEDKPRSRSQPGLSESAEPTQLTTPVIQKVVSQDKERVQKCFKTNKTEMPSSQGTLRVTFAIAKTGRVSSVVTDLPGTNVSSCIEGVVGSMVFPRHVDLEVRVPLGLTWDVR